MSYNTQLCLGRLDGCQVRLASYNRLKTNIQKAIDASLARFAEYREDVEYFANQDRELASRALLSAEKTELRRLFGLRNYYFGKIMEAEHEKRAWEATFFDSL